MIDEERFKKMTKKPIFVNNVRSNLVDTNALIRALEQGWISGAGLDVFDEEPIPQASPLLSFKNIILTPHLSNTKESLILNGQRIIAKQIEGIILGKKTDYPIKDVAYAALYLASNESKYVTGIELNINGGILAGSTAAPSGEDV